MTGSVNKVPRSVILRSDQIEAVEEYIRWNQQNPMEEVSFSAGLREMLDIAILATKLVPPAPEAEPVAPLGRPTRGPTPGRRSPVILRSVT